jgi:hypothetical protein
MPSTNKNAALIDNKKPISLDVEILIQENLSSSLQAKGQIHYILTLSDQIISVLLKQSDLLC